MKKLEENKDIITMIYNKDNIFVRDCELNKFNEVLKSGEVCFYDSQGKTNLKLIDIISEVLKLKIKYDILKKRGTFFHSQDVQDKLYKLEDKKWEILEMKMK